MNNFKLDTKTKISSGFTTPDGYFDSFSEKVLVQLATEEPKIISISSSIKIWYYTVAAVITLMIFIPLYTRYASNSGEIDSTTLENYLANHSTISEEEIVEFLQQEDLDKMKIELHLDDQIIEETLKSNSNLEEYLIN